jgi:hypothetical protein
MTSFDILQIRVLPGGIPQNNKVLLAVLNQLNKNGY